MRNLEIIVTMRELNPVMESLYLDDKDLGNTVIFGMRLNEEGLPEYQSHQMIRGQEEVDHSLLKNEYDEGAFKITGSISEKSVKSHSMILQQVSKEIELDKDKASSI